MDSLTLIVPFYRNVAMLAEQVKVWNDYPSDMRVIVIDDGSPEPAFDVVHEHASPDLCKRLEVYRILKDIPWNRGGARNLGASLAMTEWFVHTDIDHVLRADCAKALLSFEPSADHWYRFSRFRRGAADDTRKKDAIDPSAKYGPVKPHCDSYMVTKKGFWETGGYNEDFSGCLGGGTPFLDILGKQKKLEILPPEIFLEVWTRDVVKDASDFSLSRDTTEFARRKSKMIAAGNHSYRGSSPLRFDWQRVH